MASDALRRAAEKVTEPQPESSDNDNSPLAVLIRTMKSNQERWGSLKVALQEAVEKFCREMEEHPGPAAATWNDLAVRYPNSDTMLIEKHESPHIVCTLRLVEAEANASLQGTVGAAKRPDSKTVEVQITIDLKTDKNGKAYYSFKGDKFFKLDSLAEKVLIAIIDTPNQQPAPSAEVVNQDIEAEWKRGLKATKAEWERGLKARDKRMRAKLRGGK